MKKTLNIIFPALYISLLILFFGLKVGGKIAWFLLGIPLPLALVLMFVTGIMVVRSLGLKSANGKAIFLLLAGTIIKMLSGIVSYNVGFWDMAVDLHLFPDILNATGYLLMFSGLIIELRKNIFDITWTAKKITTISIPIAILSFLVIYFGVIVPNSLAPSSDYIDLFLNIGLGICVGLIFFITIEYKGGKMALPWFLILASVMVTILLYSLAVNLDGEVAANTWPYNTINLIAILRFILLGHGFFKMRVAVDDINAELKQQLTNS